MPESSVTMATDLVFVVNQVVSEYQQVNESHLEQ